MRTLLKCVNPDCSSRKNPAVEPCFTLSVCVGISLCVGADCEGEQRWLQIEPKHFTCFHCTKTPIRIEEG